MAVSPPRCDERKRISFLKPIRILYRFDLELNPRVLLLAYLIGREGPRKDKTPRRGTFDNLSDQTESFLHVAARCSRRKLG
jgi:hypothetical protein